jgi:hypothetical protein
MELSGLLTAVKSSWAIGNMEIDLNTSLLIHVCILLRQYLKPREIDFFLANKLKNRPTNKIDRYRGVRKVVTECNEEKLSFFK